MDENIDDAVRVQIQPEQGDSMRTHRVNSLNESKLIRLATGVQAQPGKRKQGEIGDWPPGTNTHRHYIQYEPLAVKGPGGKRHWVSAKPRAGEMGPGCTATQKG